MDQLIVEVDRRVIPAGFVNGAATEDIQVWQSSAPDPGVLSQPGELLNAPANVWADALSAVTLAEMSWSQARNLQRQMDMDQTAYMTAISGLRANYLADIELLTGLNPDQAAFRYVPEPGAPGIPLGDGPTTYAYLAAVLGDFDLGEEGNFPDGIADIDFDGDDEIDLPLAGELNGLRNEIEVARQNVATQEAELNQLYEQAQIIEDSTNVIVALQEAATGEIIPLQLLITEASSSSLSAEYVSEETAFADCQQEFQDLTGALTIVQMFSEEVYRELVNELIGTMDGFIQNCIDHTVGPQDPTGASWNPRLQELLSAQEALILVESALEIDILEEQSRQQVRSVLSQVSAAQSRLQQANLQLNGAILAYRRVLLRLNVLLRNYWEAFDVIAGSYFANPAYRVQLEEQEQEASWDLLIAKIRCFKAARTLEYAWARKYDQSDAQVNAPLPDLIEPFTSSTSIFRARTPYDCRNFLRALYSWHSTLTGVLGGAQDSTAVLSLKFDILGLEDRTGSGLSSDEATRNTELWQQFIDERIITEDVGELVASPQQPALLVNFALIPIPPKPTPSDSNPLDPIIVDKLGDGFFNRKVKSVRLHVAGDGVLQGPGTLTVIDNVKVVHGGTSVLRAGNDYLESNEIDPTSPISAQPEVIVFDANGGRADTSGPSLQGIKATTGNAPENPSQWPAAPGDVVQYEIQSF